MEGDGKGLFYLEPETSGGNAKLMAVNVEVNGSPGRPRRRSLPGRSAARSVYDAPRSEWRGEPVRSGPGWQAIPSQSGSVASDAAAARSRAQLESA